MKPDFTMRRPWVLESYSLQKLGGIGILWWFKITRCPSISFFSISIVIEFRPVHGCPLKKDMSVSYNDSCPHVT